MMGAPKLLFTFFLCTSIFLLKGVEGARHHHHHRHHRLHAEYGQKKLFVFGDSYADTGNHRISDGGSWKEPYGITFPGKPAGRFSDGRVFTDFLAKYMGIKSPVPYKLRKYKPKNRLKYGMNFAFGGTGVFDTEVQYPNMTTQIDLFQRLLKDSIFTPNDLQNSLGHVSLAGNDYSAYLSRGGSIEGLQKFIPRVVNQLVLDLLRIYNLGIKKISVTALQPLGCLPRSTGSSSFQNCDNTSNAAVGFHNLLLQQAVSKLNNKTRSSHVDRGSPFVIIDFYDAFSSVLQPKGAQSGSSNFARPLKPCCMGINETYSCGSVDNNGNKMYTMCQNPSSSFFWDGVHPTQAGWQAVTLSLQANLQELQH